MFLAFRSYTTARERSGAEAVAITELYRNALLFAEPTASDVQGKLVCYARAVIHDEWPAMRDQRTSPVVERWITQLDRAVDAADITGERQQAGYANWLDPATERREGRRGRLAEATPFVPQPLWAVLILGAGLVVGFLCLYADPAERFFVQAMMVGSVTAMVVAALLFIRFLDHPYQDLPGSIRPVEMNRTLSLMEDDVRSKRSTMVIPCNQDGTPTDA